ncbi:OLC1v1016935C2 [Oldenlandia corymbosa var. corymbosa]|uniref:OLC1v1016935C2 n=1 Tax=Oldenlandia corymbosa var. corymbosa TaxID=529605 RepID=A0AAV1E8C4_OLDCO|nr:OLC1v1016935C2 [Oldenlandia corymbosa var. corymbosa]
MEGLRNWPAGCSPEGIQSQSFGFHPAINRRSLSPAYGLAGATGIIPDDQSLFSAFSRLGLSPGLPLPVQPMLSPSAIPEGGGFPAADGYCTPFNYVDKGFGNVGLQGGLPGFENYPDQSLGFSGAHPNVMVGPGPWDCGGTGVVSGFGGGIQGQPRYENWSRLLSTQLNADDNGQRLNDHAYACLLYKQMLSRRVNAQFPGLPPNQNGVSRLNLGSQVNGSVWKDSSSFSPNSQRIRQNYARNKNPFDGISLQDMRGRFVSISKDHNGSKILQAKLDEPNAEEIELVLCEVIDHVADLMKNQSGSYFVQKLFGVCTEEQRTRIIAAITKNSFQLVDVCLNFNGARTMQKLLENLSTPEQISLVISALCPGGVALANDPNGQHVIRHCLITYPYEYHKHLLNEIASNCCRIATDKSGCCVLQACVENAHGEAKERLIHEIITNALLLAEDPYGFGSIFPLDYLLFQL